MSEHAATEAAIEGDDSRERPDQDEATAARDTPNAENAAREGQNPRLVPSGTDATGGAGDTTTEYVDGKIRGG